MLSTFINRHGLDVLLLQDVTNPDTLKFIGYEIHHNFGTTMCGNAILVRQAMTITNVHKLPLGRVISVEYSGLKLINVYATIRVSATN